MEASTSYESAVTSAELSLLVSEYLRSEGFARTFEQFQHEASGLLSGASARPALRFSGSGLKPLRGVLSEYLGLVGEKRERRELGQAHPLAAGILRVVEEFAARERSERETTSLPSAR